MGREFTPLSEADCPEKYKARVTIDHGPCKEKGS